MSTADADQRSVAIKQQPVTEALTEFAEKTDLQLVYPSVLTEGLVTFGAEGTNPDKILEQLLEGTGLTFEYLSTSTITLVKKSDTRVISVKSQSNEHQSGSMTTERSFFRRIVAAIATGLVAGAAGSVNAAADGTESAVDAANAQALEEIMVTARRTSENLQKVPIAVTALTPTDMEQQNIVSSTDLMYAAPSLTIAPVINSLFNTYAVRGLPTGVTTYVAESACCTGNPSLPFMDIASVQVLNGPQGTLFGRSSAAGSILIEPVRPNLSETEASLKVRFGDYGRQEFTGTLNVPITDRLAVRLAANSTDIEGYTSEIGSSRKLDEQQNQQVRLGIQFESGRFTSYTAASYIHVDQTAPGQVLSAINLNSFPYNLPPVFAPFVYGPTCFGAVAFGFNRDVQSCVAERVGIVEGITAALTAENSRIQTGGDSAIRRTPAATGLDSFVEIENWSILNVSEFGDMDFGRVNVSAKNVFSYEEANDNSCCAIDGVGGVAQTNAGDSRSVGANNTRRDVNGEIELVTSLGPKTKIINNDFNLTFDLDDGLLESVLGYYYTRTKSPSTDKGTGNIYRNWSGVLLPDLGYLDSTGFNLDTHSSEKAWYTQNTLDFSKLEGFAVKGLSFTAGYRKSWSESYSAVRPGVYDFAAGSFNPAPVPTVSEAKSDGYNYLFTLTEQFTDNFMVYLSHSRAYVPGGVNVFGTTNEAEGLPNYSPTYDPEVVEAWEVGAKIDFPLGENIPVRLNAAAYKYDFDDIIVSLAGFTSDTGEVAIYNTNAAAAELQGFELSGAILPLENLEISFSYNYNDADYRNWEGTDPYFIAQPGNPGCLPTSTVTTCVIDLSNNPFTFMPEHQGRVTVAYSPPFRSSLGRVTLSANVYAQSRVWLEATAETALEYLQPILPDARQALSQESYWTLNLRADWRDVVGSGFDAAVFVNNATDEAYKHSGNPAGLTLMFVGFTAQNYGPPRMWGAEISWRF